MPHVVGASLARAIGTEMIHVPYRGMIPVIQAMSGGELDSAVMPYSAAKSLLEKGEAKVLAFDGSDAPNALGTVPDLAEIVPDFQTLRTMLGFWVPAKTPRPIIDRLNKSIRDAAATPEVRARLADNADPIIIGTPEEFGALVAANAAVAKVVRSRRQALSSSENRWKGSSSGATPARCLPGPACQASRYWLEGLHLLADLSVNGISAWAADD